jgi:hypothetical protein
LVRYTLINKKNVSGGQYCGSGSGSEFQCFLEPRIRDGKKYGSGINITDRISVSLVTIFWVKNTEILCCGSGIRCLFDSGSGMRDGKFASDIDISDPHTDGGVIPCDGNESVFVQIARGKSSFDFVKIFSGLVYLTSNNLLFRSKIIEKWLSD